MPFRKRNSPWREYAWSRKFVLSPSNSIAVTVPLPADPALIRFETCQGEAQEERSPFGMEPLVETGLSAASALLRE